MKLRRLPFVAICFVALSATAGAQIPNVKPKAQITVDYDGPEIFARLLDHAGLRPISSLDRLGRDAANDKTILIVFGDPAPLFELEKKPGGIGRFLDEGGALFVATDRPLAGEQLPSLGIDDLRIRPMGSWNFDQHYENQPSCPTIEARQILQPDHLIFRGVTRRIATNCPGVIETNDPAFHKFAVLPTRRIAFVKDKAAPMLYLAASREKAPRMLIAAGHGTFMNCMTIRNDIDNHRLALNAIEWLKDGHRTHALLINEGKPVENFKMSLTGAPKVPVPPLALINRAIDLIQEKQLLQKLIEQRKLGEGIVRAIIILATFGMLLYGIKKYFQTRWHLEATPVVVGMPPVEPTPLLKQQMREMVRKQQLGEPAQTLGSRRRNCRSTSMRASFSVASWQNT
jgi:hypothetical protein